MTTLFIPFELYSNPPTYEWLVRGVGTSMDSAIGIIAQCRLIAPDTFDLENWIIEEVPVDVPLTTKYSDRAGSIWIVDGAVNKFDGAGVHLTD